KDEGSLAFAAYAHIGENVSMQTLQNEFFATKTLGDGILVKHISGDGEISFRNYKNVQLKSSVDTEKLPNVLRILVQQLDDERATITNSESFYPSGTIGEGSKYVLKAVLEHRPGHYVAHLNTSQGMITANDSAVH